ncbi:hypothetical protein [Corynebacterium sp. CCM 9204]|uniref:hypothetical protein n=1 Tax=Corynebacterium sp. CCM 9204 TaxID=3057616 RepID=UPI0035269883
MSTHVPSRDDIYDALRTGKALICAPGEKPDVGAWLDFTTDLLKVLRDPDITPHPDGLTIQGAYFAGGLKLNNYTINHDLSFEDCTFPLAIEAKHANIHSLYFQKCTVSSISLKYSLINGTFTIKESTINSAIDRSLDLFGVKIYKGFTALNLHIFGQLCLDEAEIQCRFFIEKSTLSNPTRNALTINHATINGGVLTRRIIVNGEFCALNSKIDGPLNLTNATLTNQPGYALHLDHTTVSEGVLADHLKTVGEVRALAAIINGSFRLNNAKLTNPHSKALTLNNTIITDRLIARQLTAQGEVRALGATISGPIHLNSAKLVNPSGHALHLDRATITGGLFADKLKTKGEVRILGATIDGQINLQNAKLENPLGLSLILNRTKISGRLFADKLETKGAIRILGSTIKGPLHLNNAKLTGPFKLNHTTITGGLLAVNLHTEGELQAPGITINGQFNLTEAELINNNGRALTLDGATITDGLIAESLTARGEIRATGATIKGQIILTTGAELDNIYVDNIYGRALTLDGATITDGLIIGRLTTHGEVRAPGATIGHLILSNVELKNPHDHALKLDGATITALFLDYKNVDGKISLVNTRISYLQPPDVIEPRHGKVLATGWKVDSIAGALHTNPETAKKWLATTPEDGFSPQPFMELARYFDRVGLPHRARHLRVYSHSQVTNNMPLKSRPGRWMLHVTSGYGERPWYALVWIVLLFGLTWLLTWWQAGHLEAADQMGAVCRDGWRITEYAGKNAIPSFPGATTKCSLADDTPIWLRLSFAFTAGLSWILLTIFLAGVTGILRKPADSSTS